VDHILKGKIGAFIRVNSWFGCCAICNSSQFVRTIYILFSNWC